MKDVQYIQDNIFSHDYLYDYVNELKEFKKLDIFTHFAGSVSYSARMK